MQNCNEIVETYYALAKIGAPMVPLSSAYLASDAENILNRSGTRMLIFQDVFTQHVKQILPNISQVEKFIYIGNKPDMEAMEYESVLSSSSNEEPSVEVNMDDDIGYIPTGGSTGVPKLVVLPQGRQFWVSLDALLILGLRDDDIYLNVLPLFHGAGQTQCMNPTFLMGGTNVILRKADPEQILKCIDKYKCTALLNMPPAFITWLCQHPNSKDYDVSSLRIYYVAGGPMSMEIRKQIFDFFPNATLYYIWGFGEAGPDGSALRVTRDNPLLKDGSCGVVMMDADWKIVDEDDNEVAVGEVGEICLRGPNMAKGYYMNEEETKNTFKDGWVHSGDLMKADEDGYIYFIDRKKDMIKSGGLNVFANEVEAVIFGHSKVYDCAVIGVPDEKWGEAVKGVVVLKQNEKVTEKELISFCKERLAGYKVPKSIDFVEKIPRNPSGKIMKFELRKQYL
jgi:feruloyl-CoA synthase